MKKFMWIGMVLALVLMGCDSSYTGSNIGDTSEDTSMDSESGTSTDTESGTEPPPDCEVVGCGDAPDDTCDVEGNLLAYSGSSVCVDHVCQYEFEIENCVYDCREVEGQDDACMDNACDGVVCGGPEYTCGVLTPTDEWEPPNDYRGMLHVDAMACDMATGECMPDYMTSTYPDNYNTDSYVKSCGDVNGCISVAGAPDYCDFTVFTPCVMDEDCQLHPPTPACEDVEGGSIRTLYVEGKCDTDGSVTGIVGDCSYTEVDRVNKGVSC